MPVISTKCTRSLQNRRALPEALSMSLKPLLILLIVLLSASLPIPVIAASAAISMLKGSGSVIKLSPTPNGNAKPLANSLFQMADSVLTNITVGNGPEQMLYDPSNGYIYVANTMSNSISVIDPSIRAAIKTITSLSRPLYMLYDPSNGYIYVVNEGSNSVSVIDTSKEAVIANITVGYAPYFLLYDPSNGYIYVANRNSAQINGQYQLLPSVSVISPRIVVANVTLTAQITIPSVLLNSLPLYMLYDPSNGYIYVANTMSNSISVIDPASNSIAATIAVGRLPLYMLYDPSNGYIYVANSLTGTVSVLNQSPGKTAMVTFTSSGLPSTSSWSVSINGIWMSSNSNQMAFKELTGTYAWQVYAPHGYVAVPSTGTVTLTDSNVTIHLDFLPAPKYCTVTFLERGLPAGQMWSVTLNGVTRSSVNDTVTFNETPGVYRFAVNPAGGRFPVPAFGWMTVSQLSVEIPVTFVTANSSALPVVTIYKPSIHGLTVTINGTARAIGGFVTEIKWNWGDGNATTGPFPQTHTYLRPGTYNVTVTVHTSNGSAMTDWTLVKVASPKPNALYLVLALISALAFIGTSLIMRYKRAKSNRIRKNHIRGKKQR